MPEGLSAEEVGKEIAHHAKDAGEEHRSRQDRILSIAEAVLLSIVAAHGRLVGVRRGEVEQRVAREACQGLDPQVPGQSGEHRRRSTCRNFDASTFNAWFSAFTVKNKQAMALAERRFRPQFKVAFDAWRRTHPETNPKAPKGPTYMPQYKEPALAKAKHLDDEATVAFEDGSTAATRSDDYVRTTVFLASVLFLVGISTRFPIRRVRYALVALGGAMLVVSIVLLTQLPGPPS